MDLEYAGAARRAVEEANRIERWAGKWLATTSGADSILETLMQLRADVDGKDERLGSLFFALEDLAYQLRAQVDADGGPGARYLHPGEQLVSATLCMPPRAALDAIAARMEARLGEEYVRQIAPRPAPASIRAAMIDTPPNASHSLPRPRLASKKEGPAAT